MIHAEWNQGACFDIAPISNLNSLMKFGCSDQANLLNGCDLRVPVTNCTDLLNLVQVGSIAELRQKRPKRWWKRSANGLFRGPNVVVRR
jgi:hypothetical protein